MTAKNKSMLKVDKPVSKKSRILSERITNVTTLVMLGGQLLVAMSVKLVNRHYQTSSLSVATADSELVSDVAVIDYSCSQMSATPLW